MENSILVMLFHVEGAQKFHNKLNYKVWVGTNLITLVKGQHITLKLEKVSTETVVLKKYRVLLGSFIYTPIFLAIYAILFFFGPYNYRDYKFLYQVFCAFYASVEEIEYCNLKCIRALTKLMFRWLHNNPIRISFTIIMIDMLT